MTSLLFACHPASVFAEKTEVNFEAKAVLPENQRSEASYYDLKVEPNQSQELTIKLKNTSSEKIKVKVAANNATTNKNGVLDYSQHDQKLLGGPSLEELISGPQTVELNPNEEKDVVFQLKIPSTGFEGTVLGGFYCYEEKNKAEDQPTGFSLANKFAYTIGIQLQCSDKKIAPELKLLEAKPGLDNGYLTVYAKLANPQPMIMSQLDLHAFITKKKQKEVLHDVSKLVSLAPRSTFKLPISWENEPLKKGEYTLTTVLKEKSGKVWTLKKDFTVKEKDESLNNKTVKLKKSKNNNYQYLYGGLIVCLLIIGLLLWHITKLRRNKGN